MVMIKGLEARPRATGHLLREKRPRLGTELEPRFKPQQQTCMWPSQRLQPVQDEHRNPPARTATAASCSLAATFCTPSGTSWGFELTGLVLADVQAELDGEELRMSLLTIRGSE
jgi:hypothetical protein